MDYIKISVVTVSYNQGKYLEECIQSIIRQGYPNFEYIVIDGGSTDNSVEIIKKYDKHIKYWVSEKDSGPANALNKGLDLCTGDYFYYLNSDDRLEPGAFQFFNKLYNRNPDKDLYYGHGYILLEKDNLKIPVYSNKWNVRCYFEHLISIVQQSTFIKMDILRRIRFNEANTTHWDGELLVDLEKNNASFYRYNHKIAIFRYHDDSFSGNPNKEKYLNQFKLVKEQFYKNRPDRVSTQLLRLKQVLFDLNIFIKKIYYNLFYIKDRL